VTTASQSNEAVLIHPSARPELAFSIERGDITRVAADAIVNAANQRMLGGGGVDGAIHRAAGPDLLEACRAVPEVQPGVRCPTGEARATPAFRLPAKYVIHTVGPVYRSAVESRPLLTSAYRSCLRLATELALQSIAFPAISCGIYGYPLDAGAETALGACVETEHALAKVRFVLFDAAAYEVWLLAAQRLLGS
jgi:O-acetyl-ADP-ribose deacetylase (regulator of RNase III)